MTNEYIKHTNIAAFNTWNADQKTRIQAYYAALPTPLTRIFDDYTFTHPATSGGAIYSFVNGDYDLVATAPELALKMPEVDAIADGMAPPSSE